MKTVPLDNIYKRPNCVVIDCFTLFITMRYRVTPKNLAIHSFLVSGQFYEVILYALLVMFVYKTENLYAKVKLPPKQSIPNLAHFKNPGVN